MDPRDLSVLLRVCKGDADAVACQHIFNQDALTQDDHLFLTEHIEALSAESLVLWLVRRPSSSAPVVERLVAIWPREEATGLVMFWLAPRAQHIDAEAYADLVERLRDGLEPRQWWWLARSLRGMCPTFESATKIEHAPELVAALFDVRRDELACRGEVLRLARTGEAVVRGPRWSFDRADDSPPCRLRNEASVIAWMHSIGLLTDLAPEAVMPDEVRFACETEWRDPDNAEEYLLRLALDWPGRVPAAAREWYIRQVLGAARRGTNWSRLLYDIVGDSKSRFPDFRRAPHESGNDAIRLVDDIAWRSFGQEVEAPWIGYAVARSLFRREPNAWEQAFRYLDRRDLHFSLEQADRTFPWARLVAALHGNDDEMPGKPVPAWIPEWIVYAAPLPELSDDAFEKRLTSFFGTIFESDHDRDEIAHISRLAQLPLTRDRANRLLVMVLSSERLLQLLRTDFIGQLADAADPPPAELLPSPERFFRGYSKVEPATMTLYLKLGGPQANDTIRQWMRAPLDAAEDELSGGPWDAAYRMHAAPDLAPEGLAEEILQRGRRSSLATLTHLQKDFPTLITDELIREEAVARLEDTNEPWAQWDTVTLPDRLADLALQRCNAQIDVHEFVALGRWLLKLEHDPRVVVACVLDRSPRLSWEHPMYSLLGDILNSRSRWETFGPPLMDAMLADGAKGPLWNLVRSATSDLNGEVPHGTVVAVHEALAVALLRRAHAALDASNEPGALPWLHALVALHPPARLSAKLRPMVPKTQPGGEARELVELNLRLLKHSRTRDAQTGDLFGAFQLLRGA